MSVLASIQILKDKIVSKIKGASTGSEEKTKAIDHREVLIDAVDTLNNAIQNAVNNGYLSLNGDAMQGDINMQENNMLNIGLLTFYNKQFSLEENLIDLQGGALSLDSEPVLNNPKQLTHKGYVDSKSITKYQESFIVGADDEIKTINHNLGTQIILVIVENGTNTFYPSQQYGTNGMRNKTNNSFDLNFSADEPYNVTVIGF